MSEEWALLERARDGDDAAGQRLVELYQVRLITLAFLITGSFAAAQDIAQETIVRGLNAELSHREGTVGGYLGTIAYRLAVKEATRKKRVQSLEGGGYLDGSENPLERVLLDERDRLLAEAIRTLDEAHRNVLVLRFYGNKSYEEIAELTAAPLGTVKSRIFYAVKSCRAVLMKKGLI